jgi:hypothetical protein
VRSAAVPAVHHTDDARHFSSEFALRTVILSFVMRGVRAAIVLVATSVHLRAARAELGVLAVAPPPGPGVELVEIALQLRNRIAGHHPQVLVATELRERMIGLAPGVSLPELERAHDRARAAYIKGDYEGSARAFRVVVEKLETLPDGEEAFAHWTRAMLRLARIELNLGHHDAAWEVLERLVRAAPTVEVDRALYPASFAKAVDRARAASRAVPTRTLAVATSLESARVYLNGRDVGAAPLKLTVRRGRHRLSAARGALRAGPVFVEVDEDEQVLLDFTMAESLRPDAGPGLSVLPEDELRRIPAAGAHMRIHQVIAVTLLEGSGVTFAVGSLYDVTSGSRTREGRVRLHDGKLPAAGANALAEFLVTGQARSALVEVPGERPAQWVISVPATVADAPLSDAARAEVPPPRARSGALGWTTLATGIASVGLAIVGVVESRAASERYDEARRFRASDPLVTLDAVRTYNRYIAEGDAAKRHATTSWVAAVAGAATTGVLGYVNYRRTGEFGPFRF